ncbi:S8 family serine peptidase [Pontibacter sp. H249]|uniref:S8 family serine peptidase n=1 Tax=Pontibacter sp. H249 TaxID=3133420 RepID=UPI0030C3B92A
MKKPLLLCLFLSLWWQGMAQKPQLQDANSSKPVSKTRAISPDKLLTSEKTSKAINVNTAKKAVTTTAFGSSDFPVYWPDRLYVKLKNGQTQFQTFENKASKQDKAASDLVNLAVQRYEATRVAELPRSPKLPAFKNTYEVVVENESKLTQLLLELNMMPEVEYAERVPYYVTSVSPNDPDRSPNDPSFKDGHQYAMNKIQAVEAFGIHTGTTKTLLAIVDDAVLSSHPDLTANIDLAKSYDVADKDNNTHPPSSGVNKANQNVFSHGTHCAGIAGAVTNNSVGIAAVSNNLVSVIGVKCTSDNTPNTRSIERGTEGVIHAINQGARVISMSYGGAGASQTVQNIINEGTANGIVFIAAAGNDNIETKHYPAAYDNVIAVASTDANDLKSSFSNYGTWVDISAPGSGILSTVTGADGSSGAYISYNGTSMSTPMVAGMVALMLSENPNLTPQAVTQILKSTADPLESVQGQSAALAGKLGAGRINAYKAIQAIKGITNTEAPTAITDLTVSQTTQTFVNLTWKAPAINASEAATLYDVRYSTSPITADNFGAATKSKNNIFPGSPNADQQLTILGLTPNTTYYFAIVSKSFYGESSLISNVATTTTQVAPIIGATPASVVFNINRDNGSAATQDVSLSNTGSAQLQYNAAIIPSSGANLRYFDKEKATADNSFGFGNSSFIAATKFNAGTRGFNLTHVQNYINNASTASTQVIVRIRKGGTNPGTASLLAEQTTNVTIPAGGGFQTIQLNQPLSMQANETFWVEFVIPAGLSTPQGIDDTGARPGVFFLSSDGGANYGDMQPMAAFLNTAALKMRAINSDWISISPSTGTLNTGSSQNLEIGVDATNLVNGTYQANLLLTSNDPVTPTINRPITVTVAGGQPTLALGSTAIDFGALFVGSNSTKKVLVNNTGVAALVINSATIAGGEFTATDFAVSPATPITIQPGTQQELSVKFTPSKKADLNGTLTLASNDPATPTVEVNLTSTLLSPPVASLSAENLNLEIDTRESTTASSNVTIQNNGEADLSYTLQAITDPTSTIKYDLDANPTSLIGTGGTLHTAMKFDVITDNFMLTHVQNYYRTEGAVRPITIKVYKGGSTPTTGTLLEEQTFTSTAAAGNNGAYITIPTKQQHKFVKGDVFYVVFTFSGITYPQAYNANNPNPLRSFLSTNGSSWVPVENASSSFANSTFKIRALEMPQWLSVTPTSGTLSQGATANAIIQANSTSLVSGTYTGRILMSSNDPATPQRTVNVSLIVQRMPQPQFSVDYTQLITGQSITFNNTSVDANAYEWAFEGAEPSTSTEATPTVKYSTPGTYKVSLVAKNTEGNKVSEPLVKEGYITVANNYCNELNAPFQGTLSLYTVTGGGHVTGNNKYGDLAKVNYFAFNRPSSYINSLKLYFGHAEAATADATVTIAVWNSNGTGNSPGDIIASKEVKISSIVADVENDRLTEIVFDAPVALSGSFFAGVILNQEAGNSVALYSNRNGETTPGIAWEQWNDATWAPFSAGWPTLANIALYIQPSITRTITPLTAAFNFIEPNKAEACVGKNVFISASPSTGVARYEWFHEGAEATYVEGKHAYLVYNTPGTYTITLKVYDTCNGVATISKTITVIDSPTATVAASGTTSFCKGGSVTLTAPTGEGYTYLWSNGETTKAIEVAESGNYTVTVTNENGCSTTSAATTVTVNELPSKPVITQNGAELTSSAAAGNQWYLNGSAIQDATEQVYTATASGNYTVRVTNANSCQSEISEEVAVTITSTAKEHLTANGLQVYPNPSTGKFTVTFTVNKLEKVRLVLVNNVGQIVLEEIQSRAAGTHDQLLTAANLPTGVYFLQVHANGNVQTRKVVVKR